MALDNALVLKDDSDTNHTFALVLPAPGQSGSRRTDQTYQTLYPESSTLYIRQKTIGPKATVADSHNVTIDHVVEDAKGTLQRGSVSITLNQPRSSAFTLAMMVNLLHIAMDVFTNVSTFDVDQTTLTAILRGEG